MTENNTNLLTDENKQKFNDLVSSGRAIENRDDYKFCWEYAKAIMTKHYGDDDNDYFL